MKEKLNEFLDKMQTPSIILMLCFLVLYLIFAESLHKDKEELKKHRKFRLENYHCQNCKKMHESRNQKH